MKKNVRNQWSATLKGVVSALLLMLLMSACAANKHAVNNASENYEKNMKELLLKGTMWHMFNPSEMKNGFIPLAVEAVGQELAEKAAMEYLEQHSPDDLLALMLPYFQETMTAEDAVKLLALKAEADKASEAFSPYEQIVMTPEVSERSVRALNGEPYENVTPVDCPESYKKKFYQYLPYTAFYKTIDTVIDNLRVINRLRTNVDDETYNASFDRMGTAMKENAAILFLNRSYGEVSESDLDVLIRYYNSDVYKKFKAGEAKIEDHLYEIAVGLESKYKEFLRKYAQ